MADYTLEPIEQNTAYDLEPVEPGFLARANDTANRMVHGWSETALAAFSGLYAWPAGKVAGITTHLLTGDIEAAKAVEEGVNSELMVKPKSEEGKAITNSLFKLIDVPFSIVGEFAKTGARMASSVPGDVLMPQTWGKEARDYYAETAGVLSTGGVLKGLFKVAREGVPRGMEDLPEFLREATGRGKVAEEARIKAEQEAIAAAEAKTTGTGKESAKEEIVEPAPSSTEKPPNSGEMYWPESDEARYVLDQFKLDLREGETKTVTEVDGETFMAGSSYQQWFRDIAKKKYGKSSPDAEEITGIINKYLEGKKEFTDRQATIFNDIVKAALNDPRRDQYAYYEERSVLDAEGIDAGRVTESREALAAQIVKEARDQGESITLEEALAEVDSYASTGIKEARPYFSDETGGLAGLSARDTFDLSNPETEWGRVRPKDQGPRTAGFDFGSERGSLPLGEKPQPLLHEFPEPINKRYKAAIPEQPTPWAKGKELLDTFYNKLTREYEHLPKTGEFAPLRFDLLNLSKYKGIASDRATRSLEEIVSALDHPTMDLFEKKVIVDDLFYSAERGMDLPYGFTRESLSAEKIILDDIVGKNPKVADAIARRKSLWEELKTRYSEAMADIGFDVEGRFQNPDYYHHQVLEYAQANSVYGAGAKLKTPTGRGFLKKREGSELDINRDYLQVEHDVMSQMIHDIKVAEVIRAIDERYNVAASLKAQFGKEWRENIPEGYDIWQPREGNVFYHAESVPAKIANELLEGGLEEYGITAEDLRGVLAVGGSRREFVLKQEIIATLDNLMPEQRGWIPRGSEWLLRQWKEKVALLNPKGFFKYNARNVSGDAEGVFVGNPNAFSKSSNAFRELYNAFYGDGKMSKELSDFFEMGGFESTLQAMEINKFGDLKAFSHLREKSGNMLTIPKDAWNWYWKNAQVATSVREATLRYASYLDYLDQMKRNPAGLPNNFGASIPEEIMGLPTIEKRAYWLQNDLLGAYDRVGVIGNELRTHIWPFWSWKEVNFRRYINLWNNAANSAEIATKVGKTLGAKAPFLAYRIGKLAVQITGAMALMEVWNNTFFKQEEENLPDNVRKSAHIVFGKDEKGNTIYFDRLGMFTDFLSNFGLDGAHRLVPDVMNGKMTIKEMAKEIAKGPLNVIAQGVSPYFKLPGELAAGRRLYPDVTSPGTIRDRKLYIAEQLKLGDEYRALAKLPSEGYEKSLKKFFIYTSDPGQAAYFDIMDDKRRFAERKGKEGEGFFITPKGNALYNYKMAVRLEDKKSAERFLDEYIALGGTPQGLMQSLRAMNPLFGLSGAEKAEFISGMDDKAYEKFNKAMDYYIDKLMQ